MKLWVCLPLLMILSTSVVAQDGRTQRTRNNNIDSGTRIVTLGPSTVQPQDVNCQPGSITANTGLPSGGGTWTATWTFTIPAGSLAGCGSPILQSTVNWIQPANGQTTCNNPPAGEIVSCTTPYIVSANTAGTRSGSLYVSFGSSGEDGPVTITQFGPPQTLSVNVTGSGRVMSLPSGINCPGTCTTGVYYGNSITLTASASAGYSFAGWSGACSGTGSCTIVMYTPQSVTAAFAPVQETFTVNVSGGGTVISSPGGISCPGICATQFPYDTTVLLTANAGTSYSFANWSGNCAGTSATYSVQMTSSKNCTAIFKAPDFSVSVSPSSQSVSRGGTTTYSVNVTSLYGFSGTVALAANGLPAGVTYSLSPSSIAASGSSTLSLALGAGSNGPPSGSFSFTVSGTSGTIVHSSSAGLTVSGVYAATATPIAIAGAGDFYYLDANGDGREMTVRNGTWQSWGNFDATANTGAASAISGSSLIGYQDSSGRTYVLYVTAAQHLQTVYFDGSNWLSQDLTNTFPGPLAAAKTPIAMAGPGDFYYLDANGDGREMTVRNGTWQSWGNFDATANTGAASAISGSSLIGYQDSSGRTYVLYVTAAQHLQTVYFDGSNWLSQDLTNTFPGPLAAAKTPIAMAGPGDFYYLDANGDGREMTVRNGTWQSWGNFDATANTGAASAISGSSLIGYQDSSGRTYILYVTAAQHLQTVYYDGSNWLSQDLTNMF